MRETRSQRKPATTSTAAGRVVLALFTCALLCGPTARADDDPRTWDLPPGWSVTSDSELPAAQVSAIGKKFGAKLTRITNTVWSRGGFGLQLNVVTAADEDAAATCLAAFDRFRGRTFVGRTGRHVIEVAGTNRLAAAWALAQLGVLRGAPVTYAVNAQVGCVDDIDYMTTNKVFNHFLALARGDESADVEPKIRELTKGWSLGSSLRMLTGAHDWFEPHWSFDPKPESATVTGAQTTYTFETPPKRAGVPYVTLGGTVTVKPRFLPVEIPGDTGSTAATQSWPVDDERIQALVKKLTADAKTGRERVLALLAHVAGEIRYAGDVGSRYGVMQVLEQGFGHCWDKSDVLITLCRSAGIPARQIAGWVPAMNSGHVWSEVKIPGEGWLPVDATTPWLGTSADYVPFYRTSDGHMPLVYLSWPEVTVKTP